MSAPRIEVRLDLVRSNATQLVERLAVLGVGVTGVTKATLGSPEVAAELVAAGVRSIGESRIENIEALRDAGIATPMTLIRSPMLSQADRVVASADVSMNTELDVVAALSVAARKQWKHHGVVLMVELGDLREGILPADLDGVVREVLQFPNIELRGIGANLACQSGASPSAANMAELSALADAVETAHGITLAIVSGGNSANLGWAFGAADVGRINDLRLGEAILLGREPLRRTAVDGLHTDAFTLVAEVIEAKVKPSLPWGEINQTAFGSVEPATDRGPTGRVIVALGRQDVDPAGLGAPPGYRIVGASSDHLVLECGPGLPGVGAELRFQVDYSALVRAMTSPFVGTTYAEAPVTKRRPSLLS